MTRENKSFHLASMRPLALLETVVKVIAFTIIYYACALDLPDGTRAEVPGKTADITRLVIAAVLTLGLVAGIYDRILDREIFALVFILLNILAHSAFIYHLLAKPADIALLLFPAVMLAGDLIKIVEIRAYHMRVRDVGPRVLYALTGVYVAGYIALIGLHSL